MNLPMSILIAFYSRLLHLYPSKYRAEFEEQMVLDFSDMAVDAGRKGTFSLIIFCLRELIDFPINLLKVHFEEGRIFKILRSQPVNTGLRSALGFGLVFFLSLPISTFVYEGLFFWLESLVTQLQLYYYDRFHSELGYAWSLWIPYTVSAIVTGLLLGIALALLFAERSEYPRYIFAGLLGWFLEHEAGYIFSAYNYWGFLTETQFWIFDYMHLAFSGAIFGLIFVLVKSEKPLTVSWLTIGTFVYLLFIYLLVKQLFNLITFNLLTFQLSWRFVSVTILMMILISSVFVVAVILDEKRRLLWVIVAGAVGHPVTRLSLLTVGRLIDPQMTAFYSTTTDWDISISNMVYGILFGLLLGLGFGFQKKSSPPEIIV